MEACEAVVLSPGPSESGTGSRSGAPAEKQPVTWRRVPRLPWRPAVSLPAARSSGARGSHRPPPSAGIGVVRAARAARAAGGTVPPAARVLLRVAPHVLTHRALPWERSALWEPGRLGRPGSLHSCPRGRGTGPCAGRQQEQLPEARSASCAEPRSRGRLRALGASGRRAGPGRTAGAVPWLALKAPSRSDQDPGLLPGRSSEEARPDGVGVGVGLARANFFGMGPEGVWGSLCPTWWGSGTGGWRALGSPSSLLPERPRGCSQWPSLPRPVRLRPTGAGGQAPGAAGQP